MSTSTKLKSKKNCVQACDGCKVKKRKCVKGQDAICENCKRLGSVCTYLIKNNKRGNSENYKKKSASTPIIEGSMANYPMSSGDRFSANTSPGTQFTYASTSYTNVPSSYRNRSPLCLEVNSLDSNLSNGTFFDYDMELNEYVIKGCELEDLFNLSENFHKIPNINLISVISEQQIRDLRFIPLTNSILLLLYSLASITQYYSDPLDMKKVSILYNKGLKLLPDCSNIPEIETPVVNTAVFILNCLYCNLNM
ncbi:hypothetical protein K502DRAFT_350713 [Neoconidiobolus thromboides FSU 785]|nr:hypothetical protein K502DRAFT_350713 [Neoconidiobolus thromboides FSU 785]